MEAIAKEIYGNLSERFDHLRFDVHLNKPTDFDPRENADFIKYVYYSINVSNDHSKENLVLLIQRPNKNVGLVVDERHITYSLEKQFGIRLKDVKRLKPKSVRIVDDLSDATVPYFRLKEDTSGLIKQLPDGTLHEPDSFLSCLLWNKMVRRRERLRERLLNVK